MITESIVFENFRVDVYADAKYLETVFSDGTKVPAMPQYDEEYISRAKELGYTEEHDGDICLKCCFEHEILHSRLAVAMGWPWSQTLWSVAHGTKLPLGTIKQEESLILEVQKQINKARKEEREKYGRI